MSFLYKALLKNNQESGTKGPSPEQTAHASQSFQSSASSNTSNQAYGTAYSPAFAGQSSQDLFAQAPISNANVQHTTGSQVPGAMWLAFGLALLVIGLLAGYIFGQQGPGTQTFTHPVATPHTASSHVALVQSDEQLAQRQEAHVTITPVVSPGEAPVEALSGTSTQGADINALADNASPDSEKLIQVGLSKDGQVVTRVQDGNRQESGLSLANEELATPVTLPVEDELDVSDIPDELKTQFDMAVNATANEEIKPAEPLIEESSSLPVIDELTLTERASIPDIRYQMHIYASDVTERWVKLNDRILTQGEELVPGLKLLEIRQTIIVWETDFNRFAQEALVDYEVKL